jgi:hypothetical protein
VDLGVALSLTTGTRLGPYEIVVLLGAGGMGEVYRARDARLARDVALKILPAALCTDADRLRRFEQEARAAGALNHPNVMSIHDVGIDRGQPFLVAELLEGETLRERLAQGALPLRRAIEIAAQAANGLAAAHAKGILHRDLKPENIFLTRDGRAKILDFGIAKLMQLEAADPTDGPTATGVRETELGAVVGTVGYMSPEQVQGRKVDQRTDLFSLGVVFYEMLSGTGPFTRTSRIGTLNAILEADPKELPNAVPTTVQRIVRRCLEKDSDARFESARDLAFAIDNLMMDGPASTQSTSVAGSSGRRAFAMSVLAGLAITIALGYAAWTRFVSRAAEPGSVAVRRFVFQPPANAPLFAPFMFALSPDGTRLVYAARVAAGSQLQKRRLDQLEVEPLAGSEGAFSPFFSPDGQSIGFFSERGIGRASVTGGAPVTIAEFPRQLGFMGASWGPDDTIMFTRIGSPLLRVPADGGMVMPLGELSEAAGEIDHHTPFHLRDGTALLFGIHAGRELFRVAARSLVSGEQRILVQDGFQPQYTASGHLVFARGSTLLATPFDSKRLAITGPEVALIENLATVLDSGLAAYSISDDGTLAYVPAPSPAGRTLVWVDRKGRVAPAAMPPRAYFFPSLSPDGHRLAVQVADGRRSDIWIHRFIDGAATRLAGEGLNSRPGWTRDGRHVTFSVRRGEDRFLFIQTVDGTTPAETLASSRRTDLWTGSWTQDEQALAFVDAPPTDIGDIKLLRRSGGAVEPLIAGPATERGPSFSPDGRWLAYESNESGRFEVYLRPFPASGAPRQISTDGGGSARWSSDGREVFFMLARRLYSVPIRTSPSLEIGPPRLLFELPFGPTGGGVGPPAWDVTPDGQRFIFVKPADDELAPRPIYVVENWFEELKRRVRPGPAGAQAAPTEMSK